MAQSAGSNPTPTLHFPNAGALATQKRPKLPLKEEKPRTATLRDNASRPAIGSFLTRGESSMVEGGRCGGDCTQMCPGGSAVRDTHHRRPTLTLRMCVILIAFSNSLREATS